MRFRIQINAANPLDRSAGRRGGAKLLAELVGVVGVEFVGPDRYRLAIGVIDVRCLVSAKGADRCQAEVVEAIVGPRRKSMHLASSQFGSVQTLDALARDGLRQGAV